MIFGYSSTGDLPTESGMKSAPDYWNTELHQLSHFFFQRLRLLFQRYSLALDLCNEKEQKKRHKLMIIRFICQIEKLRGKPEIKKNQGEKSEEIMSF